MVKPSVNQRTFVLINCHVIRDLGWCFCDGAEAVCFGIRHIRAILGLGKIMLLYSFPLFCEIGLNKFTQQQDTRILQCQLTIDTRTTCGFGDFYGKIKDINQQVIRRLKGWA
jgi:hypothetical protein